MTGPGHTHWDLENLISDLTQRVKALEAQAPQAQRLRREADVAIADAAGYGRHGHGHDCPYCPGERSVS